MRPGVEGCHVWSCVGADFNALHWCMLRWVMRLVGASGFDCLVTLFLGGGLGRDGFYVWILLLERNMVVGYVLSVC
jgi:hypothetical protein